MEALRASFWCIVRAWGHLATLPPAMFLGVGLDQEDLERALQSGEVALFEVDAEGATVWSTPNHAGIFGLDEEPAQWTSTGFLRFVHPDEREMIAAALAAGRDTGAFVFECASSTPAALTRWIKAAGRVVTGDDGKMERGFGAIHDITARKLAQTRPAEAACHWLGFLADLAETLDRQSTFQRYGERLTPGWWSSDSATPASSIWRPGHSRGGLPPAHKVPEKEEKLRSLGERHPALVGEETRWPRRCGSVDVPLSRGRRGLAGGDRTDPRPGLRRGPRCHRHPLGDRHSLRVRQGAGGRGRVLSDRG